MAVLFSKYPVNDDCLLVKVQTCKHMKPVDCHLFFNKEKNTPKIPIQFRSQKLDNNCTYRYSIHISI